MHGLFEALDERVASLPKERAPVVSTSATKKRPPYSVFLTASSVTASSNQPLTPHPLLIGSIEDYEVAWLLLEREMAIAAAESAHDAIGAQKSLILSLDILVASATVTGKLQHMKVTLAEVAVDVSHPLTSQSLLLVSSILVVDRTGSMERGERKKMNHQ